MNIRVNIIMLNDNLDEIILRHVSLDHAIKLLTRFAKIYNLQWCNTSQLFGGYYRNRQNGLSYYLK